MTTRPIYGRDGKPVFAFRRGPVKAVRDDPEFQLQRQICDYMGHALPDGLKLHATLNGVYLTPRVRERAKQTGFGAGPLDLFMNVWGKTHWMEVKIRPRKMSPEQIKFANEIPGLWGLAYSLEDAIDIVTGWRVKLKPVTLSGLFM